MKKTKNLRRIRNLHFGPGFHDRTTQYHIRDDGTDAGPKNDPTIFVWNL